MTCLKVLKGAGGLPWEVSGKPGPSLGMGGPLGTWFAVLAPSSHHLVFSVTGSWYQRPLGSGAGLASGSPGCSLMWGCGLVWVVVWAAPTHVRTHPLICRVWREELPFCAQLGRRGQRGERDPAFSLRIRRSEVFSLLAPLRATVAVATDQRATA